MALPLPDRCIDPMSLGTYPYNSCLFRFAADLENTDSHDRIPKPADHREEPMIRNAKALPRAFEAFHWFDVTGRPSRVLHPY